MEASEEPRELERDTCAARANTWGREGCGLSYSRAIPPVGRGPVEYSRPTVVWPLRPEARVVCGWVCKAGPQGFGGPPGNLPAGQGGERQGRREGRAGGGAPVVWDFSAGEKREREREREKRRVVGGAAASVGAPLSRIARSEHCRECRLSVQPRGRVVVAAGPSGEADEIVQRSERWVGSDSIVALTSVELLLGAVVLGEAGRGDDELPDAAGAAEPLAFGEGLGEKGAAATEQRRRSRRASHSAR